MYLLLRVFDWLFWGVVFFVCVSVMLFIMVVLLFALMIVLLVFYTFLLWLVLSVSLSCVLLWLVLSVYVVVCCCLVDFGVCLLFVCLCVLCYDCPVVCGAFVMLFDA